MLTDLEHTYEDLLDLDGEEFYDYLLGLGRDSFSTIGGKGELVTGCQSQVWVNHAQHTKYHTFHIDSDSIMVKGIGAIVSTAFNDATTEQAKEIKFEQFKPLAKKLTYQRQRGLQSMINKIHEIVNAV